MYGGAGSPSFRGTSLDSTCNVKRLPTASTGQPSNSHFCWGVLMLCGRCAFLGAKSSLFSFEAQTSFFAPNSSRQRTNSPFFTQQPKTFELLPSSLLIRRTTQKTEAGYNGRRPPPAPCSPFAASAAPKFAPSAVAAVAPLLGSLPNSKPQLPSAVDGAGRPFAPSRSPSPSSVGGDGCPLSPLDGTEAAHSGAVARGRVHSYPSTPKAQLASAAFGAGAPSTTEEWGQR